MDSTARASSRPLALPLQPLVAPCVLLVGEQEFDLLLMDIEMPVLDGLMATRRIRRHEIACKSAKCVPVVPYAGNASGLDEGKWRDSGIDAVLGKPNPEPGVMGECLKRWCPDKFPVSSESFA